MHHLFTPFTVRRRPDEPTHRDRVGVTGAPPQEIGRAS